jgi:hypothetical protein
MFHIIPCLPRALQLQHQVQLGINGDLNFEALSKAVVSISRRTWYYEPGTRLKVGISGEGEDGSLHYHTELLSSDRPPSKRWSQLM